MWHVPLGYKLPLNLVDEVFSFLVIYYDQETIQRDFRSRSHLGNSDIFECPRT